MTIARFSQILGDALEGGYAIAAFNVYNLESVQASIRVAVALKAPVIVALGERYFANMRPGSARALVESLVANEKRSDGTGPVVGLHLDHTADPDHCREAIRAGFSSVMIDASDRAFAENVRITRSVVDEAHANGVGVEAELGGLAAGEASHEFASGEEALTDPDQAADFVAQTGVDALAVSVGTVHGLYKGEPHIDLERLAAIAERVRVPLVLHGGSGTPTDLLRAAIARGVAKVNVNTEISMAAVRRIREAIEARPKIHFAELGLLAVPAMEAVMTDYIHRFGAQGRTELGSRT